METKRTKKDPSIGDVIRVLMGAAYMIAGVVVLLTAWVPSHEQVAFAAFMGFAGILIHDANHD